MRSYNDYMRGTLDAASPFEDKIDVFLSDPETSQEPGGAL